MNYSKPMRKRDMTKRLCAVLLVCFIFGVLFGAFFEILFTIFEDHSTETPGGDGGASVCSELIPIQETDESLAPAIPSPEPQLLGQFRVTAYCACEICCGEWAKNRPDGIVYGAYGVELVAGVSCAATLPRGTVIEVEGLGEYVVQDKIAKWVVEKYGENQVDIYFDSHEAACEFGLQYVNVYLKEENQ